MYPFNACFGYSTWSPERLLDPCTKRIKPRKSVLSFRICIASRTTITIMLTSNLRKSSQIAKNRLYQLEDTHFPQGRYHAPQRRVLGHNVLGSQPNISRYARFLLEGRTLSLIAGWVYMTRGSCSLNILFQFVIGCSSGVARNFVWDIMGHSSTWMIFFNSSFSTTVQSIIARCGCTFLALSDPFFGVCWRNMDFKLSSRTGRTVPVG